MKSHLSSYADQLLVLLFLVNFHEYLNEKMFVLLVSEPVKAETGYYICNNIHEKMTRF